MTIRPLLLIVIVAALPVEHTALAQHETLGRLFYTDRQRAALDANVRRPSRRVEKPIRVRPSVTLNGVVTRSDGERTVWIDGRAYHRTETDELEVITRYAEPGVAKIKVRGVADRRSLRVGQRLDPVSGETFEAFEALPPETRPQRPVRATANEGVDSASSTVTE